MAFLRQITRRTKVFDLKRTKVGSHNGTEQINVINGGPIAALRALEGGADWDDLPTHKEDLHTVVYKYWTITETYRVKGKKHPQSKVIFTFPHWIDHRPTQYCVDTLIKLDGIMFHKKDQLIEAWEKCSGKNDFECDSCRDLLARMADDIKMYRAYKWQKLKEKLGDDLDSFFA